MTKPDLVRMACMATLISTASCAQATEHLPGSSVPLPVILREPIDFVAVCIAEDEPKLADIQGGSRDVTQRFRLLGLVVGRSGGRSVGEMHYRLSRDGFERAVRKGERVIWLARCEDVWKGIDVLEDAPENRLLVYSQLVQMLNARAHQALDVRVEIPGVSFARGQPIPIRVQVDNTGDSAIALWSNFSALQLDVLAEDGEPVRRRPARGTRFDRTAPLIVEQYRGPVETADLANLFDWLPRGEQRSYTLIWRGNVRVGKRNSEPFEIVSQPLRLTVLDPSTLSWGADGGGVSCGLAAEKYNVSMGDRVKFQFGLKSDSLRVDSDLHIYRYSPDEQEVHFTFRNIQTETLYQRVVDWPQIGPPYTPKAEDFFRLREHPVLLWSLPVRLLHESGEQIPAGTYEVTATYESRHVERSSLPPSRGPRKLYCGPIVSGPVTVRVQQADPESIEIRTNSAIELRNEHGSGFWTASQEKPTIVRVAQRPGFGFHAWAVTSVAVGAGEFQHVSEGGYGGLVIGDRFVSSTWENGFPHGLGPEGGRALAGGESLKVRVDVTIYETADAYARFPSPARGDARVVWQRRLEARRP